MIEKSNDWVMMCALFFRQYKAMWIYAMPYWSFKSTFVHNE